VYEAGDRLLQAVQAHYEGLSLHRQVEHHPTETKYSKIMINTHTSV
jgi:hypothetical protein